jgi:hypothetical protein
VDTTVILILSNVSTACIVGTILAARAVIREEYWAIERREAAADRAAATETLAQITESREHFFAFAPQPLQQHAALDSAVLPALSAQSHEDEQAPAEDDDHTGWWQLLLATLIAAGDEAARIVAIFLNGCRARALVLIAQLRGSKQQPYTGRHWVADVQHTGQFPIVPAQRDGGDQ